LIYTINEIIEIELLSHPNLKCCKHSSWKSRRWTGRYILLDRMIN